MKDVIWSGGELLPGTKVFDFQALILNEKHHLSLIAPPGPAWQLYPDGVAMVLNASYHPIFALSTTELGQRMDMHEFRVINETQTALIAMTHRREVRASDNLDYQGDILDCSFTEVDMRTRQRIFNWTASDHIPFTESSNPPPTSEMRNKPWDWL